MFILSALLFLPVLYGASASPCPPSQIYFKNSQNEDQFCSSICPPAKTQDLNIRFCLTNCPAFYACLLELSPSCPATSKSYDTSCDGQPAPNFYHSVKGFCSCASACNNLDTFCENNCPGYFNCMKRKQRELETTEIIQTSPNKNNEHSSTTAKFDDFLSPTTTSPVDDAASNSCNFRVVVLSCLCVVQSIGFSIVLVLYCCNIKHRSKEKEIKRKDKFNSLDANSNQHNDISARSREIILTNTPTQETEPLNSQGNLISLRNDGSSGNVV